MIVGLVMCFINMWITRRTLMKDFNDRNHQHLTFCWVVGGLVYILLQRLWIIFLGVVSQLTPALALFYGQTANERTINYFYRRNIRFNNCVLLLIFSGLVLHLNLNPEDRSLQNRNTLLGCHEPGLDYTMDEFGIYDDDQFKYVIQHKCTQIIILFIFKDWML